MTFCEKNKDPIHEIDFQESPGSEWNTVKCSPILHGAIGAHLCYKTHLDFSEEPIYDVDIIAIERKNRFGENKEILNVPHFYKLVSYQLPFGYLIFRKGRSF